MSGGVWSQSGPTGRPARGAASTVPAQTINQACASGFQSVALGAQAILSGQSKIVLAGGIESMSRMPYLIDSETCWAHGSATTARRWSTRRVFRPFGALMGQTAEVSARQYAITREESDVYALESQHRAERAIAAGLFKHEYDARARSRTRRGSPSNSRSTNTRALVRPS